MAIERITNGFMGTILIVDLSTHQVEHLPMTEEWARRYLGGHGVNVKLLYDHVPPGLDPLSERNALIICTGPLVGTGAPAASRSAVMAKSPQSGLFGTSNTGHLAAMVKMAGYDNIVIKGKADRAVYLKITNEKVEIKDARHLWGKDTLETTELLKAELGQQYWVAAIGPAGENLVQYASILCERIGSLGRTGMGTVMGSKNLKAIAIYGDRSIRVPRDRLPRLIRMSKDATATMLADAESIAIWRKSGTLGQMHQYGGSAGTTAGGFITGRKPRTTDLEALYLEPFERTFEKRGETCYGCPVGCLSTLTLKTGRRRGTVLSMSCTAATMTMPFGVTLGIKKFEDIFETTGYAQRWGIDTLTVDVTIQLAMELYEQGILDDDDLGGLPLRWGDAASINKVMEAIVFRQGFGNVLAEGPRRMLEIIGRGATEYARDYKGSLIAQELSVDLRGSLGIANLGRLVNPRGAHFDMYRFPRMGKYPGMSPAEVILMRAPHIGVPAEKVPELMSGEPFNVPLTTRYIEDYMMVLNSMGICDREDVTRAYPVSVMTEMFNCATGLDMTPEGMVESAERIWTLEKCFNVREGWTREDDMGPCTLYTEPLVAQNGTHPPLQREYVDSLLNAYYAAHEWDVETGIPTRRTLEKLGLGEVVQDLERAGKPVPV